MNGQVTAIKSLLDSLPAKERETLLADYTETEPDYQFYRLADAARVLAISRSTLWRMIRDGEIHAVEIRPGTRRIPESELSKFSQS